MGESTDPNAGRAAGLIDELVRQHRELSKGQARCAALMLDFAETRSVLDKARIAEREAAGVPAQYKPGEFAGTEISMAIKESKYSVQRTVAIARRLRKEAPDAWDAWEAGDINLDKAERINRTLFRLVRDNSKALLNAVVVDVAVCKTGELLGRWLNQFVARVEPDEQDERIGRSLADRYVSVRPDLDGVSFLSAALSSLDAAAIDRVLTAIAVVADPGDTRTLQQRRADALVDVLLGRISNGCHTRWNGDGDREFDDEDFAADGAEDDTFRNAARDDAEKVAPGDRDDNETVADRWGTEDAEDPIQDHPDIDPYTRDGTDGDRDGTDTQDVDAGSDGDAGTGSDGETDANADGDDWDLPASAFRPDPPRRVRGTDIGPDRPSDPPTTGAITGSAAGTHACTCGGRLPTPGVQIRPVQVNIGIIISAAALFGFTNTPGQLADRSALIPADTIRDLAAKPGTLFHRLVTDTSGNLLEVNELGRFASRKLTLAIGYRDGVCNPDTCQVSAARGDIDHVIPVPEGPTTAINLKARCRNHHRAKTHAGHTTKRTGPHTTTWTTPTGHSYTTHDDPLPVEELPRRDQPATERDNQSPPRPPDGAPP